MAVPKFIADKQAGKGKGAPMKGAVGKKAPPFGGKKAAPKKAAKKK